MNNLILSKLMFNDFDFNKVIYAKVLSEVIRVTLFCIIQRYEILE